MNNPVLSIIIPIYNLKEYLYTCIESVLTQDYQTYELILINDGSTDGSGEVCDDYARKDPRVKVFHQVNAGVSAARNLGLENAKGEWICFIDADDKIEQNSLLALMEKALQQKPDLLIAKSYKSKNGIKAKENYPFTHEYLQHEFTGYRLFVDKHYKRGSICGCVFKKDFLIRNEIILPQGLINAEDSIFITLCHLYAQKIIFTKTDFYLVTEREGSASRDWTPDRIFKMVDNLKYLNGYLKDKPGLTREQKAMLDYNRYAVVSAIFNNFYFCFTWSNLRLLKREVRNNLNDKLETHEIILSKSKIRLLNFSLNLFAYMVLMNQWGRKVKITS